MSSTARRIVVISLAVVGVAVAAFVIVALPGGIELGDLGAVIRIGGR